MAVRSLPVGGDLTTERDVLTITRSSLLLRIFLSTFHAQ
jgi:hypothetical protein